MDGGRINLVDKVSPCIEVKHGIDMQRFTLVLVINPKAHTKVSIQSRMGKEETSIIAITIYHKINQYILSFIFFFN